ncbi:MAG TPA: 3-dehydroquinate synthase [Mycobacteriales bacterium]|nr:3-dehydroquinate synthase [Mycobacteriales bacterium]
MNSTQSGAGTADRVRVGIPGAPYDVVVGTGLLGRVGELVPFPQHAGRVALVTCGPVGRLYADQVAESIRRAGLAVEVVELPDGEVTKTLATVERCYRAFARMPLGRDDVVVALGGGVVGDVAGFAAASWNRGVAVVQVPTTVLAQVDAAIGGKTGVNLPEGKNLVGAFHQPLAVLADVTTLGTLPDRERRAGLGEVVKYGFIADPAVLGILERSPAEAVAGDPVLLADLVRRSVAVKARVVAADERESGQRALLNYGHTVGHAIESLGGYATYRHGEAVGLGMVFAARLGERLGVSQPGLAGRTADLLTVLGLPVGGIALDREAVWRLLARDKKTRAGVRFVLCERPGQAVLVDPPDPAVVDEILDTLASDA